MINKHSCTAATARPTRRCVGLEARREFRPLEQTTFYCTPYGRWLLPSKRYTAGTDNKTRTGRRRWKPVASRRRRVLRSILLAAAHRVRTNAHDGFVRRTRATNDRLNRFSDLCACVFRCKKKLFTVSLRNLRDDDSCKSHAHDDNLVVRGA